MEETTAIQQTTTPSEFAQLLQSGRILDALEYRAEVLEEIAADERGNCTAAKLMSLGAIAGSIPLLAVAVPGVPLVTGLAAFLYAKTVWDDWQNSKKLCLFPGSRAGLGDLMAVFGMAAEKMEAGGADHEDEIVDFLNLQQAYEFKLLGNFEPQLADLLQKLPPQDRVSGYRYILRRAGKSGTIPGIQDIKAAIAAEAAEPSDSVPPTQLQRPDAALPTVGGNGTQPDAPERTVVGAPSTTAELLPAVPRGKSPITYLIGDRLRTSLIVSVSGGGKDFLLANALRAFLPKHPGFRVIAMDCKDDEKEYGYFGGLPNVAVYRLNVAVASDGEIVEWVDSCIQEFNRIPEKALLICNEGTLIRAKCKRYIDAVASLVSSGDSRQKFAWEAGQSAHADELGISGSARSRFRPLIIGMKGEEMQVEAILQAKFVADSARNMDDARAQMMRSPVNRAWSDGQAWYAMPQMENHCGYDRDTRQFLKKLESVRSLEGCLTADAVDDYHLEQFNWNASSVDLDELARLFDEVIGEENDLPEEAIAIHEYALKQADEWVKVRDIQRANLTPLKGCLAEQIKELFLLLEEKGKGVVEGDEAKMYKPFK